MSSNGQTVTVGNALDRKSLGKRPTLAPGIYDGVVLSSQTPGQTIDVLLTALEVPITCIWVAGIFSNMFGFSQHYLPPGGTSVVVYVTGKHINYIMGSMPSKVANPAEPGRTVTDEGSYADGTPFAARRKDSDPTYQGQSPYVDMVEGEFALTNLLDVGIMFLKNMAALQAGDRAKVECFLMDDLVRIISGSFKHYNAFGEHTIRNDGGKLNVAWHGSSHEFEADGRPRPGDPRFDLKPDGQPDSKGNTDGYTEDGRWRYSNFVGWLGDFVHGWVTDPTETLGRLAEAQTRSGKFGYRVGGDGSLLVQSVSEIAFEKVVRIVVPIPIRRDDDPQGNRSDSGLGKESELATWTPSDQSSIFEMVYQLRAYARWLNNRAALSRFRQMDRDFRVPTEAETPTPDVNNKEEDRERVNPLASNWRLVYATMRIFRDGSILHLDAYGNSWMSSQNGIQISSTKNILIEAAGSVSVVAGRDINLLARNNVGITAVTQAVRIKAQTALQMFCAAGHMVLETATDYVLKIRAAINANNTFQLTTAGHLDTEGNLTGRAVFAELTNGAFGEDRHMFHIFPGAPVISQNAAVFSFQSSYDTEQLYETMSQQAFRAGEQQASGVWSFADNAVAGKGSPWPGASPTHKTYPGVNSSLHTPSTQASFNATADAMVSGGITFRYT